MKPIDPRERFGGTFAAAVCCMDGRIQLPIIRFIQERYGVRFVDIITEPGPIRYLADRKNHSVLETIRKRLQISVEVHGSRVIAVSGHHDCAGNPVPKRAQLEQLARSVRTIRSWGFEDQAMVKLWVNELWKVDVVD
jgi:carbonic anhydrase